jgi:glutamate 5-kinase
MPNKKNIIGVSRRKSMKKKMPVRVGIKIGSSLLTDGNGIIYIDFITHLCRQITELMERGHEVFLVTSGAVHSDSNKSRLMNLRAAVGMARLINLYSLFLSINKIEAAQMLLTADVFRHPQVLKETLEQAFAEKVLPVINYNDVIDNKELSQMNFSADNDNLFKQVCFLVEADVAIIGTKEKGLYDHLGNKVSIVRQSDHSKILKCIKGKSETGYGDGMRTKTSVLFELSGKGIKTILAPGREPNFVLLALDRVLGEENDTGTLFI